MSRWTLEEDEFLKLNYCKILTTSEIADYLGKTRRAVMQHAYNRNWNQYRTPHGVSYKLALTHQEYIDKAQVFMVMMNKIQKKGIALGLTPHFNLRAFRDAIKNTERVILI